MAESKGFALITGGSRGIGRAIALKLASDGQDIAFCYRANADAAKAVEKEAARHGGRVFHRPCNVADFQDVQAFVRACEEELGTLEVLINCAGIVRDKPLVLMEQDDWHQVLNTNLTGTFNFCRCAVFGFMKRKRGVIINISSVVGVHGNATQSNYAAAKAGIIGFSKALAKEVAHYNIRVNVVAPGYIDTEMTAALDDKHKLKILSAIPMRRIGEASDVADLVSVLASERARYVTGQTMQIDGGLIL